MYDASGTSDGTDDRRAVTYLIAPDADDYVALMDVLQDAVAPLDSQAVRSRLAREGTDLPTPVVVARLTQLKDWGVVSARNSSFGARGYTDLVAGNWVYTATPLGRAVHRFHHEVLCGGTDFREVPVGRIDALVGALESIVAQRPGPFDVTSVQDLFSHHEVLDRALHGAEDALAGLAGRFDLDDTDAAQFKDLVLDYASHVASRLEEGSRRAHHLLASLREHYGSLAAATQADSRAASLVMTGKIRPGAGGAAGDFEDLESWCDPTTGRAAVFSMRLLAALPSMHANIRRLHTAGASGSSRANLLRLAVAAADPVRGSTVWAAATSDHSWRKLAGTVEDPCPEDTSWREGPGVELPVMLRTSGRTGTRGRAAAARDDSAARDTLARLRSDRQEQLGRAVEEVLANHPGPLSERAAALALAAVNKAARAAVSAHSRGPALHRSAATDGLACTVVYGTSAESGRDRIEGPDWTALLVGRTVHFHRPGTKVLLEAHADQVEAS